MQLGRDHPLQHLFIDSVWRRVFADLRLQDPRVADYVSGLLTDFAHVDNLYRIRDARSQPLEDVGEMLIESNPCGEVGSFDRERDVRKHIGDYTLFMIGLSPERVSSARRRRQLRLDALVDYVKAGKESYAIVSAFDQFKYGDGAPLFRRLSENFELCIYGLNLVKQDLERFRQEYYRRLQATLDIESSA